MFYIEEEKRGFEAEENHVIPGRFEIEIEPNEEKEISVICSLEENIEELDARAIITNEEPLYDAIGQIRSIYPNVLKLEIQNSKTTLEIQQENLKEVKNKSEIELFNEFYKFQNNVELNDEQKEYIEKIIKEVKEN